MSAGKIMLVGIGPGSVDHMTQRARAAIAEADTVIGYVTYIKLVQDLLEGKEIIRKSMTEELDRAVSALGAVGGTSSGATETSTLALAFNPLLSVAVRMIS